jgi:hypothetical protein
LVLSGSTQGAIINEIDPNLSNLLIHTQERYQDLNFFRSASKRITSVEIGPDDPGLIIMSLHVTGENLKRLPWLLNRAGLGLVIWQKWMGTVIII